MVKKPKTEGAGKKPGRAKKGDAAERIVADSPKMTPTKKLTALLASSRAAYKESRSIVGELGAEIKEAAENDHLHKKAFASVKAADRMEPEALADYFAHRDHYEDVLGLRKRAGSVLRMNLSGEKDEPVGTFGDAKDRTSNVKPFPQAQAAE